MGLDSVELVMAFEEEFDISIPDAEAEKLITPRLTCDLIENYLAHENRHIPRDVIDAKVRQIVFDQIGVDDSVYHPDAEYIRDLGVD